MLEKLPQNNAENFDKQIMELINPESVIFLWKKYLRLKPYQRSNTAGQAIIEQIELSLRGLVLDLDGQQINKCRQVNNRKSGSKGNTGVITLASLTEKVLMSEYYQRLESGNLDANSMQNYADKLDVIENGQNSSFVDRQNRKILENAFKQNAVEGNFDTDGSDLQNKRESLERLFGEKNI
jgi:hypothetical protein